ncbi:MAG: LemA family protein [Acholeplasma sp.]|nr:LemA family protein [Acholeplasma sp.]
MSSELIISMFLTGLLGIVLIVFIWVIATMNLFNKLIVKVDEAESGVDVALQQRYDVLVKLVEVTKGYAKYEKSTLESIVELRRPVQGAPMSEKQSFSNVLSDSLSKLNVVLEQYPDLKASNNYLKLQEASVEVEENLQAARRVYNANVSYYNQKLVVFPNSVIANWKKFSKRDFFEAESVKRNDVEFNL